MEKYETTNLGHVFYFRYRHGIKRGLSRPDGKVIILGSVAANNITNQTNIINLTNITRMNITDQTQMNISGLQRSFFQADVNESRMETPSQSDFQPPLSRYDRCSLGK